MTTIKNILVGTDFSASSEAALDFAVSMAGRLNAKIRLVHVYDVPTIPSDVNYTTYMPDFDSLQEVALKRLAQLASDYNGTTHNENSSVAVIRRPKVQLTWEAYPSFPTDKLIQLSYDPLVDLMILGATGENGFLDKIFGTVASRVAKDANCPVLLVPRDAEFHGLRHIVYASSSDSASLRSVRFTLDFAKYFLSAVHFVHVKKPDELFNDHASEMLFTRIVEKENPPITYSIDNIQAKTVKEGINAYVEKNHSDLVIVVTHERTFWGNFMHDSTTKAMAWDNKMPLLIMHTDEKRNPPV